MANHESKNRYKFGMTSLGIALIPVVVQLVAFGLLDSYFAKFSMTTERWIVFFALILPAVIGAIVGLVGLVWKDRNKILASIGLILCLLIAAFYTLLLGFAG